MADDVRTTIDALQAENARLRAENAGLVKELQEKTRGLELASQHKSQFLANMSHELRTPLNAVIGYSEMLQEELEDLHQADLISDAEKINAAGRHLLSLINDILDLSKIEAGKMELFLESVDVAALVRNVTTTIEPLIGKNGNTLTVDVEPGVGEMQADATRLRQILFNLLGNAAKFTDHGTIELRVARSAAGDRTDAEGSGRIGSSVEEIEAECAGRLGLGLDRIDTWKPAPTPGTDVGAGFQHPTPSGPNPNLPRPPQHPTPTSPNPNLPPSPQHPTPSGPNSNLPPSPAPSPFAPHPSPLITFAVSDSGIGMTDEQIGRLFQAFSQAEASTTRRFGGTGLGLALVQHFCQMMGGNITVASTPGHGSTFTVTLPAEASAPSTQHTAPSTQDPAPNSPVVLVVDDDPAARDLLRRHLEAEGVRVVGAAGGEEGLRLARQIRPSLVTLDVLMPGMDGWAVLGALKGDPVTADIPVVVLTLLDDDDLGYALGAADYLTKPIERERLIAALRRHVRRDERAPGQDGIRRALVVEDDPATREMLRRMLQREGWAVEEAANGRIGLEQVARAAPELILLDLMMPELDGFGFAERLRAEPAWRTIPVLVITAKDLTPEERLKLNGWVEQVLQKGAYSREELLAEVRALVRASVDRADTMRSRRADDDTR